MLPTIEEGPDKAIQSLEAELEVALSRKRLLESELEFSILSLLQISSSLPTELLIEIFSYVHVWNFRAIANLMLVNRTWHQIVRSTPKLWTTVHITLQNDLAQINRCISYCALCIERSLDSPLDICLNYELLHDIHDVRSWPIIERASEGLSTILAEVTLEDKEYLITRMVDIFDVYYKHCLFKPLRIVVGNGSSNMVRWRSFELIGGDCGDGYLIIKSAFDSVRFSSDTPILEILKLQHLENKYDKDSVWLKQSIRTKYSGVAFPNLSSLTSLILDNVDSPLCTHTINPQRIETLNLLARDMSQFNFALRCQNVTTIRLGIALHAENDKKWTNAWMGADAPLSLFFPNLLSLQVAQNVPSAFWATLDAPLLQTICFEDFFAFHYFHFVRHLPSVVRVELRWPYRHNGDHYLIEGLGAILERFPLITRILCPESDLQEITEVLETLLQMLPAPDERIDDCIQYLEMELELALSLQNILEEEINRSLRELLYPPYTDISSLPSELLIEVFSYTHLAGLTELVPLMLVNRTWRQVIISTPRFWATIDTAIPDTLDAIDRDIAFCTMCIERSGQSPLDIRIDHKTSFVSYRPPDWPSMQLANEELSRVLPENATQRNLRSYKRDLGHTFYLYYEQKIFKSLTVLAGHRCVNMTRWRSFEMKGSGPFWSGDSDLNEVFKNFEFRGNTSTLKRLKLSGVETAIDTKKVSRPKQSLCIEYPRIVLQDLSQVEDLEIDQTSGPFCTQSINPSRIRILNMEANTLMQFSFAFRCSNVTTLRIGFSQWCEASVLADGMCKSSFCLPNLLELETIQVIPVEFWTHLDAPSLKKICFRDLSTFEVLKDGTYFPSVTRVEFRWGVISEEYLDCLKKGLRVVIDRFPSVNTLLCAYDNRKEVLGALEELHDDFHRSESLKTLYIVRRAEDDAWNPRLTEAIDIGWGVFR